MKNPNTLYIDRPTNITQSITAKHASADNYGAMTEDLDVMIVSGFPDPPTGASNPNLNQKYVWNNETQRYVGVDRDNWYIEINEFTGNWTFDDLYSTTWYLSEDDPVPDYPHLVESWDTFGDGPQGSVESGTIESLTFTPSGILDPNDEEVYQRVGEEISIKDVTLTGITSGSTEISSLSAEEYMKVYVNGEERVIQLYKFE